MENKLMDTQESISITTIQHKKGIGLSLIALGLDLFPIILVLLRIEFPSYVFLFIVLSPIVGLMLGIVLLSLGKKRIGMVGKILAMIAIVIPLLLVVFIVVFYIGVETGSISFM